MAKVEKRRVLDVEVNDYIDFYDVLEGKTPDQVVEAMKYYQEKYVGRDVYFDIQSYGYDGGKELKIRERRLENDKEFEKRIAEEKRVKAKEKEAKATKEAREFLEYQRLQKKFGNIQNA
jgi:hypothetical protein